MSEKAFRDDVKSKKAMWQEWRHFRFFSI